MENDNQELNTQNNNELQNKKSNSVLVIIMGLIIIGLVGYIVYTKVIEKDEPKPIDNTQEKENNNSKEQEETNTNENNEQEENNNTNEKEENNNKKTDVVGTTYKTKDGKKSLKITKKTADGYSAEYNGIKLNIQGYDDYDKYGVFFGDKAGNGSQCGEYYLVVNNENQELINMDYDHDYVYVVKKVGSNYIFIKRDCPGVYSKAVYTEDLKTVAKEFIIANKNSFYAMKDGYITKFDSNGKELKHSSIKPDNNNILALDGASIIDDNFYALVEVNSKLYLYDFSNDKKIEFNNPYKSYICPDGNCGGGIAQMGIVGKKLLITLSPAIEQERVIQNEVSYIFNPANGKIDSIGNFLTFDEDKDAGKGNFYLYDDTSLYKYDNNGNLVTKTSFDYNKVVETAATWGFVAYKGNFFVVIKENGEYYLQDAFKKDKYKIDILDGYEFYNMSIVKEHKDDEYVATNIIELSLTKKGDPNDGGSVVYKFNIDNRQLTK